MNDKQIDLSIVIPAYNEAKRIGQSLETLAEYLKQSSRFGNVEVIVVAARGRDKTLDVAKAKKQLFETFVPIDAGAHIGKGRDVKMAMLKARGKYRIFMDADLATPLKHLEDVQKNILQHKDVIIGTRDLTSSHKGLRKFISSFGNILIRILLGLKINDTQCGFKCFRDDVATDLFGAQTITGWGFDMEVLAIAKYRKYSIVTLPIEDWQDVAGGTFKNVAVSGALSTFKDLLKIKLNLLSGKYKQ